MGNRPVIKPVITDPALDKSSEYYIPHDYRNRPSQDPNRARPESPPYDFDAESASYSDSLAGRPYTDPILAFEWYFDKITQKNFHLAFVCRTCEEWKPSRVIRPQRKGAVQPEESCFGCWFGHFNGDRSRFTTLDQESAFAWFSKLRDRIIKLELRRQKVKGRHQKHRLDELRQEAFEELKRAKAACLKHGINPALADKPEPIPVSTQELPSVKQATCENCVSWCFDEVLSNPEKDRKMGYCWAQDGRKTRSSYWCADHKFQ